MKEHKPQWVTQADLARLAKVTRQAVSQACRDRLAPAVAGDRVDRAHPAVVAFLALHDAAPIAPSAPGLAADADLDALLDSPDPVDWFRVDQLLGHLTVRQIVDQYGERRAIKDWLDSLHRFEQTRGRRLDNDATEDGLIDRELVKTHVFGALDLLRAHLVDELPSVLAKQLYRLVRQEATHEACEAAVRTAISQRLKTIKQKAIGRLRGGAQ